MDIENIKNAILQKRVRITNHADEETVADHLVFGEISFSVFYGEIIESYPDDYPVPSCLIYGKSPDGEPIHSVWAYNIDNQWTVLITVYRPDPNRWINWRVRRPKDDAI